MSLFTTAQQFIAGGVNSPVRAFASVGGEPVFFKSAAGARVRAEDGREFIDYVGSWGPMILGHAHPAVLVKGIGCVGFTQLAQQTLCIGAVVLVIQSLDPQITGPLLVNQNIVLGTAGNSPARPDVD